MPWFFSEAKWHQCTLCRDDAGRLRQILMISHLAGIALGIVMCFAGASKVAMGQRWPQDARSMGAPTLIIPVLPWMEITVGALLVTRVLAVVVGLIALGMIMSFTGLIIANLSAGRRPVCACFGTWSARPLGWSHIARNGILALLAVISILG